jgi:1-acyl-sn-glycerol-3-phosphate acyltransferase
MKKISAISFLKVCVHLLVLRPFIKLFSGVNIIGKDNFRGLGRYIIIANHNSHLDILLLYCILPVGDIAITHPVAEKVYFSKSRMIFRLVSFLFRPIWITRGQPDPEDDPFREIAQKIDEGHNIIVFPEGTRGRPGELQHFKSGIGRLVSRYPDIPIVPVFLSGPERALPKASFIPLPFWSNITIGPPQKCKGYHRDITHLLENIIKELSRSESARSHKRKVKKENPPQSIAFLGIDGSGKSTLSRVTAEELSESASVCLLSDELEFYERGASKEIQPLLTEKMRVAIGRYAKTAGSLKFYKIPKLTELLLRNRLFYEAGRWYRPEFIVMDGCPLLNMVAWAVLYKKGQLDEMSCYKAIKILTQSGPKIERSDPIFIRFPELRYLKRLKLDKLKLPDIVVFLDVSPATACDRISARGEQRQIHETEDKLAQLRQAYLLVCDIIQRDFGIPTLIMSGDDRPDNIAAAGLKFIKKSLQRSLRL